MQYREHLL